MANYQRQNNAKIKRVFSSLGTRVGVAAEQTMCSIMRSAMVTALGIHDQDHMMHIQIGDTYGWLVLHNQVEVARDISYHHRQNAGSVTAILNSLLPKLPKKGWVGILVAGMQPSKWFALDYEIDVLEDTAKWSKPEFINRFKQLL